MRWRLMMLVDRIGSVSITKVQGSQNLYARYRRNGKQISRSLKTNSIKQARELAGSISKSLGDNVKAIAEDHSFNRYMMDSLESDRLKVVRGERAESILVNDLSMFQRYCEKPLGSLDIRKINYNILQGFVDELTEKGLASSSIKRILVLVSKALKMASRNQVIQAIPLFPEIRLKQKPRGWFSNLEYKRLLEECIKHEKLKTKVRQRIIDSELRRYIIFMVNSFLRPSDSRQIRNRHIEVIRTEKTSYLRISTDHSKTINTSVISMPRAVDIYKKQLKIQKLKGYGKPSDYVFLPEYENRVFAYEQLRRQFRTVCTSANLDVSPTGDLRSIYSLRHTAIISRLLDGNNIDLVTLARNARTSVEMIDRFYAKHLTAEMNIEQFQSTSQRKQYNLLNKQ